MLLKIGTIIVNTEQVTRVQRVPAPDALGKPGTVIEFTNGENFTFRAEAGDRVWEAFCGFTGAEIDLTGM